LVRTAPRAKFGEFTRGDRALDATRDSARRLREAGVPEPEASAEVLLSELLGIRRSELARRDGLTDEQTALYASWISRRLNREPVQRILGHAYFRDLKLKLSSETLIPRPDTESVVEAALHAVDRRGGVCRVLDVGTGTGAIAIAIAQERARCEVHATDISQDALETARHNAKENVAEVSFYEADLFPSYGELDGIEVLVSNPPYVESREIEALAPEVRDSDPRTALDGGPDGLLFYRRIFVEAMPFLVVGADVILEVGDGQAEAVLEIGRHAGYEPRGTHADLTGTPRAALLRWPG
jgi:release factor glutamine methyltransferase